MYNFVVSIFCIIVIFIFFKLYYNMNILFCSYLAHGCSMQSVACNFYVSKSTVSKVIRDTCKILWEKLSPIYLPRPTADDFKKYAQDFQKLWNMPNCFGAIDGKHIIIQSPYNTGTSFFNYKKTFSIVLMAVCAFCDFILSL